MLSFIGDACHFYWKRYKRRFLYCFFIYYLIVAAGGVVGVLASDSINSTGVANLVRSSFKSTPMLSSVAAAYTTRKVALAIGLTFGVNLVFGSFACITAGNMLGLGVLVFLVRPFLWGLFILPLCFHSASALAVFGPILLLEGAGYILAFAASIDIMLAVVEPTLMGHTRRIDALKSAWLFNMKSYVPVSIVLFVAAVAEVILVTFVAAHH
jgi:hypothetical protein